MRTTGRLGVGLATLCTVLAMTAGTVQAGEPDPPPTPRIIGGTPAAPGAWPSQVGLLSSGVADNYQAQFCGGTVIDPSWILTAAHCLEDEVAGGVDVLTGTQSLAAGGVRHRAAELRMFSKYNPDTYDYDFGLIRLSNPTDAPLQTLAGQSSATPAGTMATTTGWGNMTSGGNNFPYDLYQVSVPVLSNTQCANAGYHDAITARMICAGASPYLTKDSCQGDSGGPLVVFRGGRWVQVGITSWGDRCAAGAPGVYSRVAAQSDWIKAQIRFGPHSDANAFVRATWRGLFDNSPSGSALYAGVAAQGSSTPAAWLTKQIQGKTYQARMGGVTRLYRAFFLRDPDAEGMNFWWTRINSGWTLWRVAEYFSQSPEFASTYGSLTNGQYVDLVYQNVLGRTPDAGGRAYWIDQLARGVKTRGAVMVGFSDSAEYIAANKARTDVLISYFGLVGRLPTSSDISYWVSRPNATLVGTLFSSLEYHARY